MTEISAVYQTCPDCKFRHYHGEPCPKCFHTAKDKLDIQKHIQVFGTIRDTD